jgi:hypothetical protein
MDDLDIFGSCCPPNLGDLGIVHACLSSFAVVN